MKKVVLEEIKAKLSFWPGKTRIAFAFAVFTNFKHQRACLSIGRWNGMSVWRNILVPTSPTFRYDPVTQKVLLQSDREVLFAFFPTYDQNKKIPNALIERLKLCQLC